MKCETCQDTGLVDIGCGGCSGTGEGQYDGGTCASCKGSGEFITECPESDCNAVPIKKEDLYEG